MPTLAKDFTMYVEIQKINTHFLFHTIKGIAAAAVTLIYYSYLAFKNKNC